MEIIIPQYAAAVVDRLTQNGYKAYIVGGCVRDSLMGKAPHDHDVCTDCTPDKMLEVFKGFHVVETGLKHGTLTVMSEHEPVEVTTFRSDGDYTDHRRPDSVHFERELSEDLKRRDFTVNAMCFNQNEGLIDMFGGREDLESGIIRCVGNAEDRFEEDALRIIRALRFASVLDFEIEENTASAMRKKAHLLEYVSAERVFCELKKLLCGKAVFRIMQRYSDLMALIVPELEACIGCTQNCIHHCYDVYGHICKSVENIEPDEELRLAMMMHDIAKPLKKTTDENGADHFKKHPIAGAEIAKVILKRFKSSNKTAQRIIPLITEHDNRIPPNRIAVKRLISKYDYEFFSDWLKVRRADTLAQSEHMREEKLAELDLLADIAAQIKAENACLKLTDLAVNGRDMIEQGYEGQAIKQALNTALEAVIDERIENSREAILAYLRSIRNEEDQS